MLDINQRRKYNVKTLQKIHRTIRTLENRICEASIRSHINRQINSDADWYARSEIRSLSAFSVCVKFKSSIRSNEIGRNPPFAKHTQKPIRMPTAKLRQSEIRAVKAKSVFDPEKIRSNSLIF